MDIPRGKEKEGRRRRERGGTFFGGKRREKEGKKGGRRGRGRGRGRSGAEMMAAMRVEAYGAGMAGGRRRCWLSRSRRRKGGKVGFESRRQRGRGTDGRTCVKAASEEGAVEIPEYDSSSETEIIKAKSSAIVDSIFAELKNEPSSVMPKQNESADIRSTDSGLVLRRKIESGIVKLGEGLVERDTECRLLMLGALCGEHVLLIGPPGTAKSELGRRLSAICKEGTFFSRLLTRFSVPEELFGPLSMVALENDEYVRKIDNYLPDAEVVFIDEVFKANSAILNSLLTILNEKLFDNGTARVKVPLLLMVGASNELPESEELDALYDRFLIRKEVKQVSEQGIQNLLTFQGVGETSSNYDEEISIFTKEDFRDICDSAVKSITVPENVVYLLADLRRHLQEEVEPPVYVSDRRLIKVVNLLRVAAHTNNRDAVSEFDCLLLKHCLWNKPEESIEIARWLSKRVTEMQLQGIEQIQYVLAGMFGRACRAMDKITIQKNIADSDDNNGVDAKTISENDGDSVNSAEYDNLMEEVVTIRTMVIQRLRESRDAEVVSSSIINDHLWLSDEDKKESLQMNSPQLIKSKKELTALLTEVVTLETALLDLVEPVVLAELLPSYWSAFIRKGNIAEIRKIALNN